MSTRFARCRSCPETLDVTSQHFVVVSQVEAHDPPGHVMTVDYSTQVATYHLACVPAHLDGRRGDLIEQLWSYESEREELKRLRDVLSRARTMAVEAGLHGILHVLNGEAAGVRDA